MGKTMTPGLLMDLTSIPLKLGGLESVTHGIAVALLGFMVPFTLVEMNIRSMDGNTKNLPNYSGFVSRLLVVVICLLIYNKLFYFILKVAQAASFAVLSEQDWGGFLSQAFRGDDQDSSTFWILLKAATSIQDIVLFLSSLVAITAREVVLMVQGCFLALLYAFGPIALVCGINPGASRVTRGWLTNSIQVASWSFILRLVVRVWLELEPMAVAAADRGLSDYLGILSVNITFIIMVLGTPIMAAKLLSGENLAAFGTAAVAAVQFSALAGHASRAGKFVNAEVVKFKRAPEDEQRSFFHHPIVSTMTNRYERAFGYPVEPKKKTTARDGK